MRLIPLSGLMTGLILTGTLRADIVYTLSPQEEAPSPCIEVLFPEPPCALWPEYRAISPKDQTVFSQKRWPHIMKGALWSKKQETTPLPVQAKHLIPRLKSAFAEEGVPSELAWVAEVESTLVTNAVSKTGALGLFQFKPTAAKRFDLLKESADHRTEPDKSARAAARYLSHLHSRLGDWTLAVAAYNAGEGCVERLLKQHGARTFGEIAIHLPPQTQVYVIKVMTTLSLRENTCLSALPAPR